MEKQTLKKYFEIAKEYLSNGGYTFESGICEILGVMYGKEIITYTEKGILLKYLEANKPTKRNAYKEFTQNEYWLNNDSPMTSCFWWTRISETPKAKQIRIDYLTKLIDNIK